MCHSVGKYIQGDIKVYVMAKLQFEIKLFIGSLQIVLRCLGILFIVVGINLI